MAFHYFDYASSCPPYPEALAEFTRVSAELYGNPSSVHFAGRAAHKALEEIKLRLGMLCQVIEARFILTSGGTEANNLVIRGLMDQYKKGRLLLAVDVHESAWFAKQFYRGRTDVVPLEKNGRLSLKKIQDSIKKNTILLSTVHVCNETGVIHDIAAYSQLCRENKIFFHCDGAQALGHIRIDLKNVPVDFYTLSSHKFGGPRGAGGIFLNSGGLSPQILGGGQEQKLRAGTENVAVLAAAVVALEKSHSLINNGLSRLNQLTDLFLKRLSEQVSDYFLNSKFEGLPGLVSISFPGTIGTNLVTEMSLKGFALSAGSACHSNDVRPSRIITALGRSEKVALGTVRISMGYGTTKDEVEKLVTTLGEAVNRQRMLA
jgi:cysteine desulfurase